MRRGLTIIAAVQPTGAGSGAALCPPLLGTLPAPRCAIFHYGYGLTGSAADAARRPPLVRRLSASSSSCAPSPLPPPEWVDPFLDISDLAAPRGDTHLPPHPSPWLARVLALLRDSLSVESDLDTYCRRFLIRLSPAFVSHALRSPDLRTRPDTSLRFFRWAARQPHYPRHLLESYVALVGIYASSSSSSSSSSSPTTTLPADRDVVVRKLVSEVRELGLVLTPPASSSLIKSLGEMGMVEELLWVWRRMKESGVEPSAFTYNCLLGGLVNASYLDSAERVFDVMRSGKNPGILPDTVTYNIMIKGYCRAGNTRAAIDKVHEMEAITKEEAGICSVAPDKITYMMLIQAHYADGDVDACLRLYHEMEEKGLEVPTHVYSLVIGGLCRAGRPFQGMAVRERMTGRGYRGNVAIYTALMDSLAKTGNGGRAMELLEEMKSEGLDPDAVTHSVVVNCLCKAGRLREAVEWFESCKDSGVAVNAVFYSTLIDGFGKAGMAEDAVKLFEEMVERGFNPDSYCYNALIDALCKAGRMDDALAVFNRMESGGGGGCDRTVYTFTMMMEGLFKQHRNEEALKMWDAMIDGGITPTPASFRVMSRGLCLSGKVARACKVLDELAPMGVVPETAHEDMMEALCGAGRVEEACRLADGIVERGREVPGRVRTLFINALRKAGKAELAIKLVHSKIGIGYDRMGSIKRRVKFQTLLSSCRRRHCTAAGVR